MTAIGWDIRPVNAVPALSIRRRDPDGCIRRFCPAQRWILFGTAGRMQNPVLALGMQIV
jgi:hypothetical protein